jgi:hypothetical protein
MRQRTQATQKNNQQLAKDQAGIQWTREQRQNVQALQARLQQLQQEEDDLLLRIGQAERLGSYGRSGHHRYYVPNGLADQLPYLRSHLNDVRDEKDQVRQQLEQVQH